MMSERVPQTASSLRWLSIVGIGEDGVSGLGDEARARIADADIVFGGRRHLALANALISREGRAWPSPFEAAIAAVLALRGRKVCVLASADPFHYGVGATLSHHIAASEMVVLPAPSAFSLAAARVGWPLQDVVTLSLHGRPLDLVRPHLHPGCRILALTSDGQGPAVLAALLSGAGFGRSRLTILEALGGPSERVRSCEARQFELSGVNDLNVAAIEVVADPGARILPLTPGLPDALFSHDGQMTKREVRAVTLSALAPRRNELLWDIGAGAGSVAIEWMLADPSLRVIAIEAHPDRAAGIERNAAAFGVPGLEVVAGAAPAALEGLRMPDAIFIGGGGSDAGVMETAQAALRPGGRLVANAVTLEMEAVLLAAHAQHGGDLIRIALARAEPIGAMTGWRAAMPVSQWAWTKP